MTNHIKLGGIIMVEIINVQETKVNTYDNIAEFVESMNTSETKRLFTYFNSGFLGIGQGWTAAFMNSDGTIHGFYTDDVDNGFTEMIKPIYDKLKEKNMIEVDGMIKAYQTGAIKQFFQPENPEDDDKSNLSLLSWINATHELPADNTIIQYITENEKALLDATKGNQHLIIQIDGNNGRNLERALQTFQNYKIQDNTPIVEWYLDLKK
jgi:hypothetical protein